jgi:hypothetical protein
MRWLPVTTCVLSLTGVLAFAGCGGSGFDTSGGTDNLTMQFLGFNGDEIEQEDFVGNTSADVDVCQSICNLGGDLIDIEFESFTETHANAVFMNMGASPILLDKYVVSIPGSGIPDQTVITSALLPGGTCSNSPSTQCSSDANCGLASTCEHVETSVEILLYSFVTKELVRGDKECPRLDFENNVVIPGTVTPQTYQTNVTFSGSDATGERFTIKAGLVGGFFDANNCSDSGGGEGG